MRSTLLAALILLSLWLPVLHAAAAECTSSLYDSLEFSVPVDRFSPYERVFVTTTCTNLEAGEYTMRVNWIHQRIGLFRSDTHSFRMDTAGKRLVYFWFKLAKKGPLSSTFSGSDFHQKTLGMWTVETYLNDARVSEQEFEIIE